MSRDFFAETKQAEAKILALRNMPLGKAHWREMPIGFQNPHCDFAMVHAPTECVTCDEIAFGLQHLRYINHTNFTGHHDPDKAPCPSEVFRLFENANKWGGNHADVREGSTAEESEHRRRNRWLSALKEFQLFFKMDRELRQLRDEQEALEQKIRHLDRDDDSFA
jgi:hypothetical protein